MPDDRRHRGAHPLDAKLFANAALPQLREAVEDYSWLLGRGYAAKSALALVGDRFQLHERQRKAVMRVACSPRALEKRAAHQVQNISGATLWIDGFNVLITVEAALAGAAIFRGCDGCLRDIASLHGTFRSVEETVPALEIVGKTLAEQGAAGAKWLLDKPVSNSGRLKTVMLEIAAAQGWNWDVELVFSPDAELARSSEIIATADGVILDNAARWFNLSRAAIEKHVPGAWFVDLRAFDFVDEFPDSH